ncbi:MAG: DNA gyrase subunit A [Gammaproteobacteria bacterium]|nr:DNA gyrase subunit A [Gammaproteobacteria bacterium]MCP4474115.1 DNA gyrase subunit A [Gammaproteobacteria bacterium]
MGKIAKEIINVSIEEELKRSYLDYAMSVIVGRALPEVRDGLKPVHRRILYAMDELSNHANKSYKKSARIVGDVIGKYHPHGDTAVYDAVVRMAQPFSLRYMLVDGQGNFGSIDGDSPAAMRYTEVRMTKLAHALLVDIDKETISFSPNYDESEMIPDVLPTRVPNLLVNGASGIAVGMATNIPPHNMNEVLDACLALIDNPDLNIHELMTYIPGPDFPTAGIINGTQGIIKGYATGRGRVVMRARATVESEKKSGRESVIVTELPYQVNKARLVEKIAQLVKDKKIEGISELRDESDKDGIRVVVDLRRGTNGEVVLNNLYSQTQMESTFGINMVALVEGQPRLLNLKQVLEAFIAHRREVVTHRTHFDLRKAEKRAHLLEGLGIALANIDPIVVLIKGSKSAAEAKEKLLAQAWPMGAVKGLLERSGTLENGTHGDIAHDSYQLSVQQAQAILDLRLHRLTGLEQDKLFGEYEELLQRIGDLAAILAEADRLITVVREELVEVKAQFGDPRRTEIIKQEENFLIEDLIEEEDIVITLSHVGYIKTQPLSDYQAQRRGGRGKSATRMKEEDVIDQMLVASTHDTLLCFSTAGKLYWLKGYQLPSASRQSRGLPIVNLLPLQKGERVNAILPVKAFDEDRFVFMATASGIVKKTPLTQFSRPRSQGIIALTIDEGDELVGVEITDGKHDIMLFTTAGKAIRFHGSKVRPMGRNARGVIGIKMAAKQRVVALVRVTDEDTVLMATANGYGKQTRFSEFATKGRGGQGMIAIDTSERNGCLIAAKRVKSSDEVILISDRGTLVRTRISEISVMGRYAQGVRLIGLANEEQLVSIEIVDELQQDEIKEEEVN